MMAHGKSGSLESEKQKRHAMVEGGPRPHLVLGIMCRFRE